MLFSKRLAATKEHLAPLVDPAEKILGDCEDPCSARLLETCTRSISSGDGGECLKHGGVINQPCASLGHTSEQKSDKMGMSRMKCSSVGSPHRVRYLRT